IDAGTGGREADEAFLAGMLHGVGELVLLQAPEQRGDASGASQRDVPGPAPVTELSCRAGAYLLGLWNFADRIVEAVAYQRQPSLAPPPANPVLLAVHVALHLTTDDVRLDPAVAGRFDPAR